MRASKIVGIVIFGFLALVCGLLALIMLIDLATMGPDDDNVPAFLAFSILCAGLVALIVLLARGKLEATTHKAAQEDLRRYAARQPERATSQPSSQESLERMLMRSEHLFASAADLASFGTKGPTDDTYQLACMVKAAHIDTWAEPPRAGLRKLSRNGQYWIWSKAPLQGDALNKLLALEGALNLNARLTEGARHLPVDDPDAIAQKRAVLAGVSRLPVKANEGAGGEWGTRYFIANAAESAPAPFRITLDFACNLAQGLVVLSLDVPNPESFAIVTSSIEAQHAAARAYALRSSLLVARIAFAANGLVSRVVANAVAVGSRDTVLSLDLDRQVLDALLAAADSVELDGNFFPQHERVRASFSETGGLNPVEPYLTLASTQVNPAERYLEPELDLRPCPGELFELAGARTFHDLGINENAGRTHAWRSIAPLVGGSTQDLMAALEDTLANTPDITVAEACTRTREAALSADADANSPEALFELFVNGNALDRACRQASELLNNEDPDDAAKAIALLEDALAPIDQLGMYDDDQASVYRYFGSIAERIHFNLHREGDTREVRLVPDAYFNAHRSLATAYRMREEYGEAMNHLNVLRRIAPSSVHVDFDWIRILEGQSRMYEAVEVARHAACNAWTPSEAGISLYRLAYLEWKVGKEELTVACYERSLAYSSEVSDWARSELDDLLKNNDRLSHMSDDEARAALRDAQIAVGFDDALHDRLLSIARVCTNHGSFVTARPLVAIAQGYRTDDALEDVRVSLLPKD